MKPLYAARLEEQEDLDRQEQTVQPKLVLSPETRAKLRRTAIASAAKRSRLARLNLFECPACHSEWSALQLARGCPTCKAAEAVHR